MINLSGFQNNETKLPAQLKNIFNQATFKIKEILETGKKRTEVQETLTKANDIQKSHLANMLGSDNLKIIKKGSELKEKLNTSLSKIIDEKDSKYQQIVELKNSINCEPTDEVDEWTFQGLKSRISLAPKVFKWDDCYQKHYPQNSIDLSEDQKTENSICELKRKYNSLVRNYIEMSAEVIQIQTMIDNIEEKKNYELTVKQASTLGF